MAQQKTIKIEQVGSLERGEPGSLPQHAEGHAKERLDGLSRKARSGRKQLRAFGGEEREHLEEGKAQEGNGPSRRVTPTRRQRTLRTEKSPEGGAKEPGADGNIGRGPEPTDERATASDELVRLCERENP